VQGLSRAVHEKLGALLSVVVCLCRLTKRERLRALLTEQHQQRERLLSELRPCDEFSPREDRLLRPGRGDLTAPVSLREREGRKRASTSILLGECNLYRNVSIPE
jgi:hypothetical protein